MTNISPAKKAFLLLAILLFPSLLYIVFTTGKHNIMHLKIFGPREEITVTRNGKEVIDTNYHTIPEFSFINHYGEEITEKAFDDKIYVSDFFFTTCQTICPKMSVNMSTVQNEFLEDEDVLFISHTVNPKTDTVETLAAYAEKMNAQKGKWHFVTGKKKEIYDIARHGYYVTAMEGNGGPDDFIHSNKLVLIDKKGRIRGFYDGTDEEETERLIDEIKVLKAEEHIPKKRK